MTNVYTMSDSFVYGQTITEREGYSSLRCYLVPWIWNHCMFYIDDYVHAHYLYNVIQTCKCTSKVQRLEAKVSLEVTNECWEEIVGLC